jgi:hypothetical protein
LRGDEIPVDVGYLPQADLKFFPENPRIYSILSVLDEEPTQEEIERMLLKREHVKQLIQSIKANGGLTDPIFVRGGSLVVLEGNSRLAAYRALANRDPIKWGKIKCKVLPETIDEDKIFSLLGEYHIIGKQDWAPYEQAGYLYRRYKNYSADLNKMATDLGLTLNKVKHLVDVYSFMIKHKDNDVSRWSYYDELLKSRKIGKYRKKYPEFDKVVVQKIKFREIPRAADVRDNLKKIVVAGDKAVSAFLSGKRNFEESVERAESGGADQHCYQSIRKFRNWIVDSKVKKEVIALPESLTKKVHYELKKIKAGIEYLEKQLRN